MTLDYVLNGEPFVVIAPSADTTGLDFTYAGEPFVAAPSGTAHTYWRINVTANAGDTNYLAIAEVEMRATVGGADECSGGTATASSSSAGFEADKAFDNDAATRWSTPTPGMTTGWLQYQFASPVDVTEYTIQAHPSTPARSPKNWTLEYSDDGTDWTVTDTRTNEANWADGETRVLEVGVANNGAGPYTYWRLNVSANDGHADFLGLAEMEMRATVGGTDQCSGGTAATSSQFSATFAASKAFDNDTGTAWVTVSGVKSAWLRYQFASAVDVAEYTIRAHGSVPSYSPKTWKLQGSGDGTTWYQVDERSNETGWTNGQIRTYALEATNPATDVTGESVAQGVSTGSGVATQEHITSGLPFSQSTTTTEGETGQTHVLSGENTSQGAVVAAGAVEAFDPVTVAGENAAQGAASTTGAVTQDHSVSGDAIEINFNSSDDAVVQVHVVSGEDSAQPTTADGDRTYHTHVLAGESANASVTTNDGTATVIQSLTGAGSTLPLTYTDGAVTQQHALQGEAVAQPGYFYRHIQPTALLYVRTRPVQFSTITRQHLSYVLTRGRTLYVRSTGMMFTAET
jgi:hypothetical protein